MKSFLKLSCLFSMLGFVQTALAQTIIDDNNALGSGSWGAQVTSDTSSTSASSAPVTTGPAVSLASACGRNDQSSLPYRTFLNLMQNNQLNISHNSDSGQVVVDGGRMISNCNSMLKTRIEPAKNGRPHLFHVEIKKPAGCTESDGKTLCKYTVDVANDPEAPGIKSGTVEVTVEPNYFGFMKCLKDTGVLVDGVRDNAKIVEGSFRQEQSGLTKSGDLVFYSKGPVTSQLTPRFGALDNVKGGSCDTFEKISPGGFKVHSKEDVAVARKEVLFDEICAGGDYKAIDKHLPDFQEFQSMYGILKSVRNNYLLEEVKELHTELKQKDLSELDADKFKDVLTDFNSKIIIPLKDDIAVLYSELKRAGSRELRSSIQEEIDEKVNLLLSYNKVPYVTAVDLESMKSFAKKAPLDKEEWRDAAIVVYKSNNSAFHYGRYASDSKLPKISISEADDEIAGDVKVEASYITKLGNLASDSDRSYAREYAAQAQDIQREQMELQQALQQFYRTENEYIRSHCMNPQKYWINRQKCVANSQEKMQGAARAISIYNQDMTPEIARYNNLSAQWAQIEGVRNTGKGVQPNPRDVSFQNQNPNYQFSFAPPTSQQQQGQNQQWVPTAEQNMRHFQQINGLGDPAFYNQGGFGLQPRMYQGQPSGLPPRYPSNQPGVYPSQPAPGQYPPGYFQNQQQQRYPAYQQQYQNGAGMGFQYRFGSY